jgi:hypothetical protein
MGRPLAPVRRAQELLLADRTLRSVLDELKVCFGVSSTEAIAIIVVGRSLNRYAGTRIEAVGGGAARLPAPPRPTTASALV